MPSASRPLDRPPTPIQSISTNSGSQGATPLVPFRVRGENLPRTKTGRFEKAESDALDQAVEGFRCEYGLEKAQVNELLRERPRAQRKDLEDLWNRIFSSCPGRDKQSMRIRARAMFHNFDERQDFTDEQNEQLKKLVELHGRRWLEIGPIMNRHPEEVRKRWENIVSSGTGKKGFWNREECEKLASLVVDAVAVALSGKGEPLSPVPKAAEKAIPWRHVADQLGGRSPTQCHTKWMSLRNQEFRFKHQASGTIMEFEPTKYFLARSQGTITKPVQASPFTPEEDKHTQQPCHDGTS
jgi:hypothetical protein